jgi:hypothetical protein
VVGSGVQDVEWLRGEDVADKAAQVAVDSVAIKTRILCTALFHSLACALGRVQGNNRRARHAVRRQSDSGIL